MGNKMVFGKDQNAKEESVKAMYSVKKTGIRNTQEFRDAISNGLKNRWKDPERKRINELHLKEARKKINLSEAGKKSHLYENEIAKTIQADKIYLPNEVCDRIVVRNGEIFFIEIKRKYQRLRPKQEEFRNIAKDKYEILREQ
jgi:hypothetical protein